MSKLRVIAGGLVAVAAVVTVVQVAGHAKSPKNRPADESGSGCCFGGHEGVGTDADEDFDGSADGAAVGSTNAELA